jgi:DNA-binding beta-propeller fold protein YncE
VVSESSSTVTPIAVATSRPGSPITVGSFPDAIAMSARTGTAYVASFGSDTVTPITIATNTAGRSIPAGYAPDSVAVTPDGKHLVVSDGDSDQATVIDVAGRPARHVSVGYSPDAGIAVTGSTAIVLDTYGGQVSLFSTRTRHAYAPITVGNFPVALAITG